MDTAVTIPTGAMAERWKWSSFLCFGFFICDVRVPAVRQLGLGRRLAVSWARSSASSTARGLRRLSVVHMVGGMAAAGWGHRSRASHRQATKDGKPVAMPGHHIPMALVGTLILAFGWFGFNPGIDPWPGLTCASA